MNFDQPILKEISLPANNDKYAIGYESPIKSAKLDIIRGVASGLHFNDIKFFIEQMKGTAENDTLIHRFKENKAYKHYKKNYDGKNLEFALSPETIKRILNNQPYLSKDKE